MMKRKILFIINPNSGKKKNQEAIELINSVLDKNVFEADYIFTQYPGHAFELTQLNINKYEIITAVGGDGTVNEIANAINNTKTSLAIIPSGSGNGLARFLKIPMNIKKAVETINTEYSKSIDTIHINDKFFANVSGVGFDALIGDKFQKTRNRGFINYIRLVLKEFARYKSNNYVLSIDGKEVEEDAFLISFANSGQFGNNAYISPFAEIDDGKIDVVIMRKFPIHKGIRLAIKLFNKTLHDSSYIDIYKASEVKLINNDNLLAHIDGEPVTLNGDVSLKVNSKSLKVICPV